MKKKFHESGLLMYSWNLSLELINLWLSWYTLTSTAKVFYQGFPEDGTIYMLCLFESFRSCYFYKTEILFKSLKKAVVSLHPLWGSEDYILCLIYIDLSMLRCFHSNHWPPRWPDMVSWILKQKICITKSLPKLLFQCCK